MNTEAKREMAQRLHEDHGATINRYPVLRWEFGVLYRDMDAIVKGGEEFP